MYGFLWIALQLWFQFVYIVGPEKPYWNLRSGQLSVIVRKNRAIAKDRGRPFTFMFSRYESYLKRLATMAFGEVAVRFSSRYHYFEILETPAT